MERVCKTCRFYDPILDGTTGRCRRYAPRPGETNLWPTVNAFDWCGEWQEKPPPPPRRVVRRVQVENGKS